MTITWPKVLFSIGEMVCPGLRQPEVFMCIHNNLSKLLKVILATSREKYVADHQIYELFYKAIKLQQTHIIHK